MTQEAFAYLKPLFSDGLRFGQWAVLTVDNRGSL